MDSIHGLELSVNIFQANLHWNALLIASILRRPRPPLDFGIQILSHAISGRPFSVFVFSEKFSVYFIQLITGALQ